MNLIGIMLRERNQTQKNAFCLYEIQGQAELIYDDGGHRSGYLWEMIVDWVRVQRSRLECGKCLIFLSGR